MLLYCAIGFLFSKPAATKFHDIFFKLVVNIKQIFKWYYSSNWQLSTFFVLNVYPHFNIFYWSAWSDHISEFLKPVFTAARLGWPKLDAWRCRPPLDSGPRYTTRLLQKRRSHCQPRNRRNEPGKISSFIVKLWYTHGPMGCSWYKSFLFKNYLFAFHGVVCTPLRCVQIFKILSVVNHHLIKHLMV